MHRFYATAISFWLFSNGTPCTYDTDEWFELLSLLLQHGADVNAQDNDGDTPLELTLPQDSSMELDVMKVIAFHQHNSNM